MDAIAGDQPSSERRFASELTRWARPDDPPVGRNEVDLDARVVPLGEGVEHDPRHLDGVLAARESYAAASVDWLDRAGVVGRTSPPMVSASSAARWRCSGPAGGRTTHSSSSLTNCATFSSDTRSAPIQAIRRLVLQVERWSANSAGGLPLLMFARRSIRLLLPRQHRGSPYKDWPVEGCDLSLPATVSQTTVQTATRSGSGARRDPPRCFLPA